LRDNVIPRLNADEFVFVSLDVGTDQAPDGLAAYADENEFPWLFAVMTPELQAALIAQFGGNVTVPPTTPQWVLRPNGGVVGLIGDSAPDTLVNLLLQ
jgi:hypothetical protein